MRQTIRDRVKAQIATLYAGSISTKRVREPGSVREFIEVVLATGDTFSEDLSAITTGNLEVSIHKSGVTTDAELDAIGELVTRGIFSDRSLGDLVHGITPAGFRYEPVGESQYDILVLLFNVIYEETYT